MNAVAVAPSASGDGAWSHRAALVLGGAIALGILPLFVAELVVMANMSMYQFYPFVFAFVAWRGWTRWKSAAGTFGARQGKRAWLEFALLTLALACLVLHAGLFGPWLGGAAGMIALAAALLSVQRFRNVQLWDLWALLLVSMRMPLDLNYRLAGSLQRFSAILSDYLLDLIGVLHYRAGNVIQLASRELFVDEACSGVISVMSVIAVAAILAIVRERRVLHTVALIIAGVLWAMIMNVLRICAIAIALDRFGIDWTHGAVHEAISLVGFTITCLAVCSTDVLLAGLLQPVDDAFGLRETLFGGQRLLAVYNWLTQLRVLSRWRTEPAVTASPPRRLPIAGLSLLASLFVLAGLFHTYALWINYRNATENQEDVAAIVKAIQREKVAAALAPWEILEDEFEERDTISELAPYSRSFTVKQAKSGLVATVSLDFPFYRKWHDVCGCYVNAGWEMDMRKVERMDVTGGPRGGQYVVGDFHNAEGIAGHVEFANLNEDGKLIVPPDEIATSVYVIRRLIGTVQHRRQLSLKPTRVFQIQVFAASGRQFSRAERTELRALFYAAFKFTREFLQDTTF